MVVTEVLPLDKKRRKVYVDNEYAFPLYLSEIRRLHIEPGNVIEREVADLIRDVLNKRIRERIFYLLDSSPRTEYEIRNKLIQSGYTENYFQPVISKIKEYGYIDDLAYARMYVESLKEGKKYSKRVIEGKLYQKGIAKDIVEVVFEETTFDETEQIRCILAKKRIDEDNYSQMDYNSKRKLYAYLMSKGFSTTCINSCLGEISALQ